MLWDVVFFMHFLVSSVLVLFFFAAAASADEGFGFSFCAMVFTMLLFVVPWTIASIREHEREREYWCRGYIERFPDTSPPYTCLEFQESN